MGRTRNALTPMIGLSLAALVAGSLVTLAVLAERVTWERPVAAQPLAPLDPQGETAAPLVVEHAPPATAQGLDRDRNLDLPPDRVLALRIKAPSKPSRGASGKREGGDPQGPDKPPQKRILAGLPPGIIKKINRGGELPPGHAKKVAAGAKEYPHHHSNGSGRGTCGEPPCGHSNGPSNGHQNGRAKGHAKH